MTRPLARTRKGSRFVLQVSSPLASGGLVCEVNLAGQIAMYAAHAAGVAAAKRYLAAQYLAEDKPRLAATEALSAIAWIRIATAQRRNARAEAKRTGAPHLRVLYAIADGAVS